MTSLTRDMKYSSKLMVAGLAIFVAFLIAWLSAPLVLPGYSLIENTFRQNLMTVTLGPHESKVISSFNATANDAVIAYAINSSTVNFVLLEDGVPLSQPSPTLAIRPNSSGTFTLVASNTGNTTMTVALTYGVFPYSVAQTFYNVSGVYQSAAEFFMVLGLAIIGYGAYLRLRGR